MVLYLFWLQTLENLINQWNQHFSDSPLVKNLPANAGDMGLIPGPGDSTCCEATKSMCHNYWTHSLDPMSCNYWACVPPMVPVCASYELGHTAGGERKCHLLLPISRTAWTILPMPPSVFWHSPWLGTTALEPAYHNYWSLHALDPMFCSKRSYSSKKSEHCN